MSLTAEPGVPSSIPALSHTFVKLDHKIISVIILLLPLIQEFVREVLVNLAEEKSVVR